MESHFDKHMKAGKDRFEDIVEDLRRNKDRLFSTKCLTETFDYENSPIFKFGNWIKYDGGKLKITYRLIVYVEQE